MDLKRLEYFCSLVEYESFSKAAKALHISQPPLSQRIKELEAEFGMQLIYRNSRNFKLTAAGISLYHQAQLLLTHANKLQSDFHDLANTPSGLVKIGCAPPCNHFIMSSMGELRRLFPKLKFRLWMMENQSLERQLQEVHLDFCLAQLPLMNTNYRLLLLRSAPFYVLYGKHCPPPDKKIVGPKDITMFPLMLSKRRDGGGAFDRIVTEFQESGLYPNVILDSQDTRILFDLLQDNPDMITIIPETEIPAQCPYAMRRFLSDNVRTRPVIFSLQNGYMSQGAFQVLHYLFQKFREPSDTTDYLQKNYKEYMHIINRAAE